MKESGLSAALSSEILYPLQYCFSSSIILFGLSIVNEKNIFTFSIKNIFIKREKYDYSTKNEVIIHKKAAS
jgi:hypothetical protein